MAAPPVMFPEPEKVDDSLSAAEKEIKGLKAEKKDFEKKLKMVLMDYSASSARWANNREELEATNNRLQVAAKEQGLRLTELNTQTAERQEEFENLREQSPRLEDKWKGSQAAEEKLIRNISKNGQLRRSVEEERNAHKDKLQSLVAVLATQRQEIEVLQVERRVLEEERGEQEERVRSLDKDLSKERGQAEALEINYKKWQKKHKHMQGHFKQLQSDHVRLRAEHAKLCEQHEGFLQTTEPQYRQPFVAILLDADGYIFKSTLLQ
ncbi:MAG: hypothetical protein Q9225_006782 [Loekoesia sp. 1 TL-2023]